MIDTLVEPWNEAIDEYAYRDEGIVESPRAEKILAFKHDSHSNEELPQVFSVNESLHEDESLSRIEPFQIKERG